MTRNVAILTALALAAATDAWAQRADENVVRAAEDAFGLSVGNERLGLYDEDNVRGFSPSLSGNVRIEGLYFDRRGAIASRLLKGSTIRVGLTAQGYDFPAPSGIVDYELRKPGRMRVLSLVAHTDSWGRAAFELDSEIPVSDTLSLGGGVSRLLDARPQGNDRDQGSAALIARWSPSPGANLLAYAGAGLNRNEEAGPLVFTAGPVLPPEIDRRNFYGQDWSDWRSGSLNYGLLGTVQLSPGTAVRAGVFRSGFTEEKSFSDLFQSVDANRLALHRITAFPEQDYSALSGELRATHSFTTGAQRHTALVSLRGRKRVTISGGAQTLDFGPGRIGAPRSLAEPGFVFGPTNRDEVRQRTLGVGYQGVWPGVGELNIGVQKTRYEKSLSRAGGPATEARSEPWLGNVNAAWYASPAITVFGGYSRGLEDGGFAPENAVNARSPLPATLTSQKDAGMRVVLGRIRVVSAVFDLDKPYYGLDATNTFTEIGAIRNRGLELSVISSPIEGLRLVGGAVISRPRVNRGALGALQNLKPIGAVERTARFSADYTPPSWPAVSFDTTLVYTGERAAKMDNSVAIPARATVSVGARYRLKVGDDKATIRLVIYNLTDTFGWSVTSGGGFFYEEPRRVALSLYMDF
ncbi:TonB-dependent receptor domain-containing protein [Phenylobacterium sp.]|uniref:TonB-dependent receptor domain-containing protein n=1 Tax=Phenylobacterium sp. TaxID=1871053 RepID=UPI003BA9C3C5